MQKYPVWCLLFLLLPLHTLAGNGILKFRGGDLPFAAHEGTNAVELWCEQDIDIAPEYALVEFTHINPITFHARLLGKLNGVTPSHVAEGYKLSAVMKDGIKAIVLTIDTITTKDDGIIRCTVISNKDAKVNLTVAKNVTVVHELKSLHLQFQDWPSILTNPKDPIEVEAGSYQVKCIAEGSNPPTRDLKLFLDREEVPFLDKPTVTLMKGEVRRYVTTAVGNVTLPKDETLHQLICLARDTSGKQLSTQLDIIILVPEEEDVQCETKTLENQRSISLVCFVEHFQYNVSEFAFEIGKTGEIIRPGKSVRNAHMTINRISARKTQVTLAVNDATRWHFQSDFYLIINSTEHNPRKEVLRFRKDYVERDEGNSSVCRTISLKWLICILIFSVVIQ